MTKQFTVEYTEGLIRATARQFLFRVLGLDGIATFSLVTIMFLIMVFSGTIFWMTYVLGATVLIGLIAIPLIYRTYLTRTLAMYRALKNPIATVSFNEHGLTLDTSIGTGSVGWQNIRKLWRLRDAWLIGTGDKQVLTIPAEQIDAETRDFIISKVKEHRGRVV